MPIKIVIVLLIGNENLNTMSKKQATIDLLQRDIIKLHKELVDKVSEIEELKFIVKILTDQLTECRAKLESKEAGVSTAFCKFNWTTQLTDISPRVNSLFFFFFRGSLTIQI